ncbi:MAG: DUF5615 family PIN-like protein [Bryobacterales bacterium]|nr:DUF5615 family PIN-like protein [Bryobacterales bacterium]
MRILLDQNLSPKLIRRLAHELPGLESVYEHNLTGESDPVIFQWARRAGFDALISSDLDLVHLVTQVGPPPKVIHIVRCDFRLALIEELLRREAQAIQAFLSSPESVLRLDL